MNVYWFAIFIAIKEEAKRAKSHYCRHNLILPQHQYTRRWQSAHIIVGHYWSSVPVFARITHTRHPGVGRYLLAPEWHSKHQKLLLTSQIKLKYKHIKMQKIHRGTMNKRIFIAGHHGMVGSALPSIRESIMNCPSVWKCNNPQYPPIQFFYVTPKTHSAIFLLFNS